MKTMIRISGVADITDTRVKVILADTGEELWLPRDEIERYGDRVYIPDWLARRYKSLKDRPFNRQSSIDNHQLKRGHHERINRQTQQG